MIKRSVGIAVVTAGFLVVGGQVAVNAAEMSPVKGYVKSSDGSRIKSGSGECLRLTAKDSLEYPSECGYKLIVEKAAAVDSSATNTTVTVVGAAGVAKGEEVVATSNMLVGQLVIPNVEFRFDSAELTAGYKDILDTADALLQPHRALLRQGIAKLNVVGYTDAVGDAGYNQKLSEQRARTVADYLIAQDPSREAFIEVMGRGEQDPIASNDTAEGRQQNRRVALQVEKN